MDHVKEILGLSDGISQIDWSEKYSLLTGTLLNLTTLAFIAICLKNIGLEIPSPVYAIVLITVELFLIIIYVYNRHIVSYDRREISIGFAISADNKYSRQLIKDLRSSVLRTVENDALKELISIKKLPSDLRFGKTAEAENYLNRKGLRSLVWGEVTNATIQGKNASVFNIRVTTHHSSLNPTSPYHARLLQMLAKGIRRNGWAVSHDDSMVGLAAVNNNIVEISMYALASCLCTSPVLEHVERSIALLEKLKKRLNNRDADVNFPNIQEIREWINDLLVTLCLHIAYELYMTKKNPKASLKWTAKALKINPRSYSANIQAARIYWELGEHQKAREATQVAAQTDPSKSLHRLNFAFFNLNDGKYGNALSQYNKLNASVSDTNMPEVVAFMEKEFEKTKKPALLFGAGFLSVKFADSKLGGALLKQFKSLVKDKEAYSTLVKVTNKLLSTSEK